MAKKRIKITGAGTRSYEPSGLNPDDDETVNMRETGPSFREQDGAFQDAMRLAISKGTEAATEGMAKSELDYSYLRVTPPASLICSRSIAADCAEFSGGAGRRVSPSLVGS